MGSYDVSMLDDPKNPNAWWAIKLRLPAMVPRNLSKAQKKRMAWICAFVFLMGSVEIYFMIKLMQMR